MTTPTTPITTSQNPLAEYTSYSFYHVLAICDCSQTADALTSQTEPLVWDHPPVTALPLGRYSPKQLSSSLGKYCILINGATDSSYSITEARWSTITAGGATMEDRNTSIAVEGTIKISEPRGVVFMNQIVDCCRAMGIDSSTAVCVLKTFFIGYIEQTSSTTQHTATGATTITNVAPIVFLLVDATGKFSAEGGNYVLSFVAQSYGAARLPQYAKAASAISIKAGNTLAKTFDNLTNAIQVNYNQYYDCVTQQLKQAATNAGQNPAAVLSAVRRVTYKIEAGPSYQSAQYVVTNQTQQNKDLMGCDQPAKIVTPASMSIEDAIHRIMSMSPQVLRDMNTGDPITGKKYDYKIHPVVTSTIVGTANGQPLLDYTVTYIVERFYQPKNITFESVIAGNLDPNANPQLVKNTIEFDYLYTGKNIDILDFDITLNAGLVFLQTATTANSYKSPIASAPVRTISLSQQDQTQFVRQGSLVQMPLFFGTQIRNPFYINKQDSTQSIQGAFTMAKHASVEVLDAKMTIFGNIDLLSSTSSATSPTYTISRFLNGQPTNQTFDWGTVPTLAKVNIRMPRNNDDESLFSGSVNSQTGNSDYTVPFWFQGYYYIIGIDHIFDNGVFTQQLSMIGLPQAGMFATTNGGSSQQTELNLGQTIGNCQDVVSGCGPTASGGAAVTPTPPVSASPHAQTMTLADANTVSNNVTQLSQVKGWNAASAQVKNAIEQAASNTGLSAITLAQICAIESSFNPGAYNGKTSATGLFQIVNYTWAGVVSDGNVPGVPPGTPFSIASNPYANANVAASLEASNASILAKGLNVSPSDINPGDLYLAHFLGAPGAVAIMRGDLSSGGSLTVEQAYEQAFGLSQGQYLFTKQELANPSILNQYTTCAQLRAASATAMATTTPLATVIAGKSQLTPYSPQLQESSASSPTVNTSANDQPNGDVRSLARDRIAASRDCAVQQQAATQAKVNCINPTAPTPTVPPQTVQQQIVVGPGII